MVQAEQAFQAALPNNGDHEQLARSRFDALDKAKLRVVLYREQRHLCVYCERRIEEGVDVPPVEHWRPLGHVPNLALRWTNLYLSCPSPGTCDGRKGGRRLAWADADEDLPWPTAAPYHDWIGFTSGGEAYVRSIPPLDQATRRALELAIEDRDDNGTRRESILNLNHPALVAARKAAIDSERSRISEQYPGRRAPANAKPDRAAALLAADPFPTFVSIRIAWLRATLGKNR